MVGISARPITFAANSAKPADSGRRDSRPREEDGDPMAWLTVSIVSRTMCSVVVVSDSAAPTGL